MAVQKTITVYKQTNQFINNLLIFACESNWTWTVIGLNPARKALLSQANGTLFCRTFGSCSLLPLVRNRNVLIFVATCSLKNLGWQVWVCSNDGISTFSPCIPFFYIKFNELLGTVLENQTKEIFLSEEKYICFFHQADIRKTEFR